MIKNIVFDLGNVLITYKPYEYLLSKGYEEKKAKLLLGAIFQTSLWNDLDRGVFESAKDALDSFVKKTPSLEEDLRHFFDGDWMSIYQVIEDTEEFYSELIDKGYNVYLLSNFAKDGFAYIEKKYEFISKAHGRIISSHVKQVKPEPDIYKTLINTFELIPNETVFFDDMECNIEAANNAGINGIIFNNLEDAKKQFNELIS